jgi:hypothetical protein
VLGEFDENSFDINPLEDASANVSPFEGMVRLRTGRSAGTGPLAR